MKLTDITILTKTILALIGTALMIYATAYPFISPFIPAPVAAGLAAAAVMLTAIFHRGAEIQQVANDIPGLANGSVTLTQAMNDLKAAIDGNTASTSTNTSATASNTAVSLVAPTSQAAAPAPGADGLGGAA